VSYCATCDGGFFKQKNVLVVGGGDVAVEDALYLTRMCSKVYLAHRRDTLRAAGILARSAIENEKLEILWNTEVEEICGSEKVEMVKLRNNRTNDIQEVPIDAVFIAVGMDPNTELLKDLVDLDHGFVCCNEYMESSAKGIFAAGDLRVKPLRQVVTAVSDGAIAVTGVRKYLEELQ
ncbi:MAG: FAD-dependent oxidoreductase, partial [Firmicutes bacterium]|nr:FAD-dependent oxidoreductase [Bacillota bacterium]